MSPESSWIGLHAFAPEQAHERLTRWGDGVIVGPVAKAVEQCLANGLARRFFFLRYGELGPHVRLRLRAEPGTEDDLRRRLEDVFLLDSREGETEHSPRVRSHHPDVDHARWAPYRPEIARYGGSKATELAEKFFDRSSAIVLSILSQHPDDGQRAAQGVLAMVATLHGLAGDSALAVRLARLYSRGWIAAIDRDTATPAEHQSRWERAFESNWQRQAGGLGAAVAGLRDALTADEEPEPWGHLAAAATDLRRGLDALAAEGDLAVRERDWPAGLASLAPSYLHMTTNRLGIDSFQEAYLGYLAARSFERAEPPQHVTLGDVS